MNITMEICLDNPTGIVITSILKYNTENNIFSNLEDDICYNFIKLHDIDNCVCE